MNRWYVTDEVKEKYIPILREYFDKLESLNSAEIEQMDNEEFELDLYMSGLAPHTLKCLLEDEFGYKAISLDDNGWELDLWINLVKKDGKTFDSTCERMTIQACGQTFELILVPSEFQ